jgi:type II secretion system protein I
MRHAPCAMRRNAQRKMQSAKRTTHSAKRTTHSAFTLVEVILSAAIVTAGLVFVIQAMGKQINVVSVSDDKIETALFLKEKTNELIQDLSKKENISPFSQTGEVVKNGRTYKWFLDVGKNADYKGLYDIILKCSWNKFGKERESALETRIYKAEKEDDEE